MIHEFSRVAITINTPRNILLDSLFTDELASEPRILLGHALDKGILKMSLCGMSLCDKVDQLTLLYIVLFFLKG